MEDEKNPRATCDFSHLKSPPSGNPPKVMRPKRRRKGQLNDGTWAPGYGPDSKPR